MKKTKCIKCNHEHEVTELEEQEQKVVCEKCGSVYGVLSLKKTKFAFILQDNKAFVDVDGILTFLEETYSNKALHIFKNLVGNYFNVLNGIGSDKEWVIKKKDDS